MKKIAKRSVEVEVQPEDISPLELLQPGKLNKRTVMHLCARSMSKGRHCCRRRGSRFVGSEPYGTLYVL